MPSSDYVFNVRANGTERAAEQVKKTADGLGDIAKSGEYLNKAVGRFKEAFTVGAIVEFTKRTIENAEAMDKLARTSNTSLEFLSKLKSGAKQTGAEFDTLLGAYQEFSRTSANLNAGIGRSGDRLHAFKILGFSDSDIRSKSAEANIAALTKRMQEGKLTAEQYAAGIRVMGEAFRELAAASEKGLGSKLAGPASNQSNTRFLAEVGHASHGFGGQLARFGAGLVAGGISTIEQAVGGGHALLAFLGRSSSAKRRDELALEVEQQASGTFGDEETIRQMEKRRDEMKFARDTRRNIAGLKGKIQMALGPDADDVLDDLEGAGANQLQYERVLRRAERAKRKRLEELGAQTTSISALGSDSLMRMGGFAGGMRALGLQQTVVRLNEKMVEHLSVIRDAVTTPDPV